MRRPFYDSPAYRKKQAELTKANQDKGLYKHLEKRVTRLCAREECGHTFLTAFTSPKRYCSRSCAATINNSKRKWSDSTKEKIARSLTGALSPYKGVIKVPRLETCCANPSCGKTFLYKRHRPRRFCSIKCAMRITGGRPTSPKASRGKAGIRRDISESLYFYSRWEANMARLYSYLGIVWRYTPKSFDIGGQMYTPDFYLPGKNTYVEVKNFWSEYSRVRDAKFRKTYKNIRLEVVLKENYLELEKRYAQYIPNWEYKNSPFEQYVSK